MASHGNTNEEELMKVLKNLYGREEASPDFKAKLRQRLDAEAGSIAPRPFWHRPALWVPSLAGAAVALVLIIALVIVPAVTRPSGALGTLQVRATDAKNEPVVTAIYVTFDNITVHRAGDGDEDGEWEVVAEHLNKTVDLLQLSGIGELLGENEIEAGKYTQMRVGVVKVEVEFAINGVTETEEVTLEAAEDAVLPSGELKFIRNFDIKAGETTVIVIDFDVSADKSVVSTGSGKWIFKPAIKLEITYLDE